MAKTCPSCGYSPIGPFIDNCPVCAEPVRNIRSDDAARTGNLPSWVGWGIGGLVVAAVLVGWWGFGMRGPDAADGDAQQLIERVRAQVKAEPEADRRARTVVITAAQLLQEFQNNPVAADQKYQDKHFELTGVVERQGRSGGNIPFVILHAGDENAKLKIECFFDQADAAAELQLRQLTKGQTITVRGDFDGQVSNLQLGDCILVK